MAYKQLPRVGAKGFGLLITAITVLALFVLAGCDLLFPPTTTTTTSTTSSTSTTTSTTTTTLPPVTTTSTSTTSSTSTTTSTTTTTLPPVTTTSTSTTSSTSTTTTLPPVARYTVSYDGNGNTGGSIPVDRNWYLMGTSVTVFGNTGSLVKTNSVFVGWNTAANGSGTDRAVGSTFAIGSANVVLYAKWVPTYTVSYDGNGNTGGRSPVDGNLYLTGSSVTVSGNTGSLTKSGSVFAGWNTAANGSGTDRAIWSTFAMGSGNVVLYAKWVPGYTVSYDGNGNTGGGVPVNGTLYPLGSSVTVSGNTGSLTKSSSVFVGWNTMANGSGTDRAVGSIFTMGSGNVVLYAKWVPGYTVSYDGNGNTGGSVPVNDTPYLSGGSVTVAGNTGSLTKSGFAFGGWNTATNGSGTDRAVGSTFAMGSGNVVLYAKWVPGYTMSYDGNGNTGGSAPVDGNLYPSGGSVTVSGNTGSLTKAEYALWGWNTMANGSGTNWAVGSTFVMGSENVVLYAIWSEGVVMVSVPGGSFQMGSPEGVGGWRESPAHTVNLMGFQMSKYEVTQAQYSDIMGYNPSNFLSGTAAPDRPVETVTWYDAVEFCNKLSQHDGYQQVYTITNRAPAMGYPIISATVSIDMTRNGYRLPTEAEWEYAAKGGDGSPGGYTYAGSNDINAVAWWGYYYGGNSGPNTNPVGTKMMNGLGLYDMSGNVWEWCQDGYRDYGSGTQTNPMGEPSGSVVRGGGWFFPDWNCRSANRFRNYPVSGIYDVGFRLARRP